MTRLYALARIAVFAWIVMLLPAWAHAAYLVSVDTTAFTGTSGLLDFQFNPSAGAPAATATVSGLTGSLGNFGVPQLDGNASGALPGDIVLGNTDGLNAVLQGVTFGAGFGFLLDVVSAPGSEIATTFALGLYADDVNLTPLLDANATGISLTIDFYPAQPAGVTTFDPAIVVTSVAPIPEPATSVLLVAGLVGLFLVTRHRRTASSRRLSTAA